jgi:quercetin dioxygenase-like cupin family protein
LDVLGPTLTMITPADARDDAPCVMRGTIPPGFAIPLHSHPDPETYLAVEGEVDALVEEPGTFAWVRIVPGAILHVPADAKHALRNR